ncbi:MAG: hypothetical protein ABI921_01315 [Panacibacter sp.]
MKTTVLAALCFMLSFAVKAQCDKNIKWVSAKSEFIDASGNVQQSRDETTALTVSSKKVTVILSGEHSGSMNGEVTDYSCKWKDKQNGKTVFKSTLTDSENKVRHATITIEAVNGKTTVLLEAEEEDSKIRLNIVSSEEVK